MTDQELKGKLATWLGFELRKVLCVGMVYYETEQDCWYYDEREYGFNLPDFTGSLDAINYWIVPKVLQERSLIESYSFKQENGLYYSETNIWDKGCRYSSAIEVLKCDLVSMAFVQDHDLGKANALALCLAVENMIDEEAKQS